MVKVEGTGDWGLGIGECYIKQKINATVDESINSDTGLSEDAIAKMLLQNLCIAASSAHGMLRLYPPWRYLHELGQLRYHLQSNLPRSRICHLESERRRSYQ